MDFTKFKGDITKCIPNTCKIKDQCVRYTSEPDARWQSWSKFEDDIVDGEECEFFWDNKRGVL